MCVGGRRRAGGAYVCSRLVAEREAIAVFASHGRPKRLEAQAPIRRFRSLPFASLTCAFMFAINYCISTLVFHAVFHALLFAFRTHSITTATVLRRKQDR